ncbi:MAG: hypothetical protein K2W95_05055 [Candidatus Obscuribacterales bacterium]|nr:hypothetical protein [Candidatus Obscuribacterales bacterium]
MKSERKEAEVSAIYQELAELSELDDEGMSSTVGGAAAATDGLSHLMKKATGSQVQAQVDFLAQKVEDGFGQDRENGQSVSPIVQSAVSHLDEELTSRGEVLTEKGMETFIHNVDNQINSSFGQGTETGNAATVGHEWSKFEHGQEKLDYATATGGIAEQEAQVRSIEKSMDAAATGQPDSKTEQGDIHGAVSTLLQTLEADGTVLTEAGLKNFAENFDQGKFAGDVKWSSVVSATAAQELLNEKTVSSIEDALHHDLQSVDGNWQSAQLSQLSGLNEKTLDGEVQTAIQQFEANGHVLSGKDVQSIVSSVEKQDGIAAAAHVEFVTDLAISDYETASPYMQNSHMTQSGIENDVRAAYGQLGQENLHNDAAVLSEVEQTLGITSAEAAVSNSAAIAKELVSDKLSVADGNLHNYIQAMEDKAMEGVSTLNQSDQAAAKAEVDKMGNQIEAQLSQSIAANKETPTAEQIDGKLEVQYLESSVLTGLQTQYDSIVKQQQSSIHNASQLEQALAADKTELNIASMEVTADAKALSNALGQGEVLTSYGAAEFLQDVSKQIHSNSNFHQAEQTVEQLTQGAGTESIISSMVVQENQLRGESITAKLSSSMDLEANLAALANDPLLADRDNLHLGKDGGFSQAQLAAMQNDQGLQKELGITVQVDDGGYGAAQWMEDTGVWMANHQAATAGIMAGVAVLTLGAGAIVGGAAAASGSVAEAGAEAEAEAESLRSEGGEASTAEPSELSMGGTQQSEQKSFDLVSESGQSFDRARLTTLNLDNAQMTMFNRDLASMTTSDVNISDWKAEMRLANDGEELSDPVPPIEPEDHGANASEDDGLVSIVFRDEP